MNNQDNYSYEEVLELTKQGIEIWKRVVVDDIVLDYEISNLGRIKSLKSNLGGGERVGYGNLGKNIEYMTKKIYYTDENGKKKCKTYLIHRLVAIMFIPNPYNKPLVDHLDTNKINNRIDNLHWVTQQENMNNDTTKKNLSKANKGKILRKLTDEEKYPYVTEEDVLAEKWKPIEGYEGIYEISNMGRVKNLGLKKDRLGRTKKGLLQPHINRNGYQGIQLKDKNGKSKTFKIHQLVAKHFIDNPNNYNIVDHINTNKVDNRWFNLRWTTQKENMNNNKTREKLTKVSTRLVIVLDRHGNIISNGLGVHETAKYIGVGVATLFKLLKSSKPYRANNRSGGDKDLLYSLNGIRAYYISKYNEEEVAKEIAEDKTDYSYYKDDLVCVYPDGRISKPMSKNKLAEELRVSLYMVQKIRDSKKPFVISIAGTSKEQLKRLKTLENIRIMYYEDYLKEQNK